MRPPAPEDGYRPLHNNSAPDKKQMRRQTRYRDGKVASVTGERFLNEPKEDPDFVKKTSCSIKIYMGGRTH